MKNKRIAKKIIFLGLLFVFSPALIVLFSIFVLFALVYIPFEYLFFVIKKSKNSKLQDVNSKIVNNKYYPLMSIFKNIK